MHDASKCPAPLRQHTGRPLAMQHPAAPQATCALGMLAVTGPALVMKATPL
jgi:hypothetical protein